MSVIDISLNAGYPQLQIASGGISGFHTLNNRPWAANRGSSQPPRYMRSRRAEELTRSALACLTPAPGLR